MTAIEEEERILRATSLDASLRLFGHLLTSTKVTPQKEITEVEVLKVAGLFYAYLKGDESK